MKKKLSIIITILIVGLISISFFTGTLSSAKCRGIQGSVCEGECCKVISGGCIAGPCSLVKPER